MIWLAVALAGAAGAACRYVVDYTVTASRRGRHPWGTLAVNLTGALIIGVVAGMIADRGAPGTLGTVAGAGFCGAYSTFSTLVFETWQLLEERSYLRALANLATLALSLPVAAAGWALTSLFP